MVKLLMISVCGWRSIKDKNFYTLTSTFKEIMFLLT